MDKRLWLFTKNVLMVEDTGGKKKNKRRCSVAHSALSNPGVVWDLFPDWEVNHSNE